MPLMEQSNSLVLLVDVQEKLTPLVHAHELLQQNCGWMLELAKALNVPALVSEHYSKGLGKTCSALTSAIEGLNTFEKVHFSCAADDTLKTSIAAVSRKQILLIGIETHVCILQTAFDLQSQGYDVFVVEDAVSSRSVNDKVIAIARMRSAGISIVTREMVLFEWLHQAGTAKFKEISQAFLM